MKYVKNILSANSSKRKEKKRKEYTICKQPKQSISKEDSFHTKRKKKKEKRKKKKEKVSH